MESSQNKIESETPKSSGETQALLGNQKEDKLLKHSSQHDEEFSFSPKPEKRGSIAGIHLIVVVHGLLGVPDHMQVLADTLKKRLPEEEIEILNSSSNLRTLTFDGVDVCGMRLLEEIMQFLKEKSKSDKPVSKISILGYSLGGLIGRYAIGKMFEKGVFATVAPMNFVTFATPHVGVERPSSWTGSFMNWMAKRFGARTGRQLMMQEALEENGEPLLVTMSDPQGAYIQGLEQFRNVACYANVHNDFTVPFCTSFICEHHEYRTRQAVFEKFPHVLRPREEGEVDPEFAPAVTVGTVAKYSLLGAVGVVASPLIACYALLIFTSAKVISLLSDSRTSSFSQNLRTVDLNKLDTSLARKTVIQNLNGISWKKFPVRLDFPHTHGMIIVRNQLVYSNGLDVLEHLAENIFEHNDQ